MRSIAPPLPRGTSDGEVERFNGNCVGNHSCNKPFGCATLAPYWYAPREVVGNPITGFAGLDPPLEFASNLERVRENLTRSPNGARTTCLTRHRSFKTRARRIGDGARKTPFTGTRPTGMTSIEARWMLEFQECSMRQTAGTL
jgi:hypothetical protein